MVVARLAMARAAISASASRARWRSVCSPAGLNDRGEASMTQSEPIAWGAPFRSGTRIGIPA